MPVPVALPGEVVVRLRASALNWHEILVRQGRYGSPLPHVLGADGAGVRADTGEEVVILPTLGWGHGDAAPASDWEILGDPTGPAPTRSPSGCPWRTSSPNPPATAGRRRPRCPWSE
ncbi:alcohol dehydrogenase catalytic domain-containing protein [Streptomyces sp. NPDC001663]|uniref:alcohol dehydrogenase catalytic domain-containing protein n=1 Tax=Streptomyces sp. NPDC001663 TaxID=3364597 RepID=UPI0036D11939